MVIVSWFWLVGAVVLSLLPALIKDVVGGTEGVVTLCLAVFAIGIAAGSLFAAQLSHVRPNLALVPIGAIIMGVVGLDLAWAIGTPRTAHDITPVAFATSFAGLRMLVDFFAVRLRRRPVRGAVLRRRAGLVGAVRARPRHRRRQRAAGRLHGGRLAGRRGAAGRRASRSPGSSSASRSQASASVWFVLSKWGKEGVRDFGALLFRALFRVEVRGLENLPPAGTRMLIAPNHVSLIDGPLLHAVLPIDASFAVDTGIAKAWWAKPFLKLIRHYTIDPTKPLAARDLIKLVAAGEPVVIFPEGRITVTGSLMKVYDGTAMIADKADAVVVPVRIEGAQRSHLSYLKNGEIKRAWFPKMTISILPPVKLPIDQTPARQGPPQCRRRGAAGRHDRRHGQERDARPDPVRGPRPCLSRPRHRQADHRGCARHQADLSQADPRRAGAEPQARARHRGRRERRRAAAELGRRRRGLHGAADHRPRAGDAQLLRRPGQRAGGDEGRAGQDRADLEGLHREGQARQADRRDRGRSAASSISRTSAPRSALADKIRGLLAGTAPRVARKADDPAVVLFTSGSEGTPKGVVLSHRNILANAAQALARVDANANDKVFNVLPVFHSFGLTGGMMMPLLAGIPIFMYPSPLHYRIVPELIYQTGATILFGTDTFLAGYARSAHAYDFRTLRLVLAGAEAVKDRTRQIYMERFGMRILEGYGVTETAPVLAMNTPMANRPGTVGRLSPLMEYAPRSGARHRGGRPPLGARPERHARLSARRKSRRARAARRTAGTTPATSSPSTPRASSPSRAAPSASPRSPARWSRCRRSKRWPRRCGRRRCRSRCRCPTRARASASCC